MWRFIFCFGVFSLLGHCYSVPYPQNVAEIVPETSTEASMILPPTSELSNGTIVTSVATATEATMVAPLPSTITTTSTSSTTTSTPVVLQPIMIDWLYNSSAELEPLLPQAKFSTEVQLEETTQNSKEVEEANLLDKVKGMNVSENAISGMDLPLAQEMVSSTTSASVFVPAPAQTDPSIQLLPPPLSGLVSSTVSPGNLRDIPLSLVSLSGNSGGSEESTFPQQSQNKETNMEIDFTQFRYHVETGKLHKIGSAGQGICPPNMRFFAVPGHTKNGACDCDYYQCSRPLIYSLEKHQCYWAWSQGPCADDEWFIFHKDLRQRGICQSNPCLNSTDLVITENGYLPTPPPSYSTYAFQNPADGKCYQAGSNGYCADRDERLLIFPGEAPLPTCRKYTFCYPLTVPQELQCIYGSKYYLESGQC